MLGKFLGPAAAKTLAGILGVSIAAGGLAQMAVDHGWPGNAVTPPLSAAPARTGQAPDSAPASAVVPTPPPAAHSTPGNQTPRGSTPAKLSVASKPAVLASSSDARAQTASTAVACVSGVTASQIAKFRAQIAKVKAAHPELAAGVAKLEAQLNAIEAGKICEADLQRVFDSLCADPQVVAVLKAMTSKMPALARMMVGDPCKKDVKTLLSLLDKLT